jgi:hypothetical protein
MTIRSVIIHMGVAFAVAAFNSGAVAQTTQSDSQPTSQPASQPTAATEVRVPPVPEFIQTAEPSGQRVLIHYVTNFDHDDNPGCVAFNAAFAALARGDEVEMLYDAGGVNDLKLWHGAPAVYHCEIPQRLKDILATQYSLRPEDMPDTYQGYLRWLHVMGVRITYNGFMANLVDLQDTVSQRSDQIEPIAEPLTLQQMLEHRTAANTYLTH